MTDKKKIDERKEDAALALRTGNLEGVTESTRRVMFLADAGQSYEDIAELLGYGSAAQVRNMVEKALQRNLHDDPRSKVLMREQVRRRTNRLLRGVWSKAIDEKHPDQFQAVDRALKILNQQASLYGLNAPAEKDQSTPTDKEIASWVSELIGKQAIELPEQDIFDVEVIEDEGDE